MSEPGDHRRKPRGRLASAGNLLYDLLRLIARYVQGFYAAVLTYLSFSFFVAIGAVWAFAEITEEVLEGSTQRFDEAVLTWVEGHRTPVLDHLALEVTALGNFATLTVLVLAVSVFLWLTHHRISVALLMIAVAGGAIVNTLLKEVFDRPRPSVVEQITDVSTQSFPSGHAMAAFIAYASVAYLGGRLEPTAKLRWTTWGLAALLILGVGASRVYLGVHYPSDVVGGFIAGLAWLGFIISGLTAVRYFSSRKPEVEAEERDLHAEEERERGLRE